MIKFTLNVNKAVQTLLWILNKKPNINKKATNFKVSVGSSNFEEVNNALSTALDGFIGDKVVPKDASVSVKKLAAGSRATVREY